MQNKAVNGSGISAARSLRSSTSTHRPVTLNVLWARAKLLEMMVFWPQLPEARLLCKNMSMSTDIPSQISTELGELTPDAQQCVLDYVRSLRRLGSGMSIDTL